MEHGLHGSCACMMFSSFWLYALNPAYGCVAPQIVITSVPAMAARCAFALSMVMSSRSLAMSWSSFSMDLSCCDALLHLLYLLHHLLMMWVSCPFPQKK